MPIRRRHSRLESRFPRPFRKTNEMSEPERRITREDRVYRLRAVETPSGDIRVNLLPGDGSMKVWGGVSSAAANGIRQRFGDPVEILLDMAEADLLSRWGQDKI